MKKPIWILVNCVSSEEAKNIGDAILKQRLGSCFDIFPRELSSYFWPPKSEQIETAKGALLIIETFEERYPEVSKKTEELHSDKLPFVGYIKIEGTSKGYRNWMKEELV